MVSVSHQTAFENDHVIVVDKPALVLTTPAREKADPRPCLGRDLQAALECQIYPVHRLDFEVSGLVMFAKTTAAHRLAQGWFERGEVLKTYRADTDPGGTPPVAWVEWRSSLARGKRRAFRAAHGKESRTRARLIADHGEYLSWDVMPLTGRPHQLRFELSDRGWPILGDVLYGGPPRAGGIALRAYALDFTQITERLNLPKVIEVAVVR